MKKITFGLATILCIISLHANDEFCSSKTNVFKSGEKIDYTIFYSVIGIYVNAGNASFTTTATSYANKPAFHIIGDGNSNSRYDWIFKVRDRYESYFDTATLKPFKFIRNISEGNFKQYDNVTFNQQTNTATTDKGVYKVPVCVQDVLSSIYYARNINYDKYKVDDKIPFNMFLDNETYNLYIKYLGKEVIKTKYGKFNAIKFKPLLVKGTIFLGGEGMTVWVTDDANHIPIRIESPISVGSVKVDMMGYSNLKYPLTSLLKVY
jgi:Protein of unknown function (DUF3108)